MMTRSACRRVLLPALVLCLAAPGPSVVACSFFMCARGGVVLAGNNEDYVNPDTKMWFQPGEGGELGRVYFGFFDGFPQGGMNEEGLFFDGAALSPRKVGDVPGREAFEGNLIDEAMRTCSTVAEVIALVERYQPSFLERAQIQFADATGDSVIVEGDRILRKTGDSQITTNYRQAEVPDGAPCPCPRYSRIESMLEGDAAPTVELFTRILAAVHQEGQVSTLYSNVYDLTRGTITLYHFHDFLQPVTLNLADELDKGAHEVVLRDLFPASFAYAQFRARYERGKAGAGASGR